jgi:hypothetical protein
MIHDIPAKSRLVPAIPITSPRFVYRQAGETDVRVTFARARAGLESAPDRRPDPEVPSVGERAQLSYRGPNEPRAARNDALGPGLRMMVSDAASGRKRS